MIIGISGKKGSGKDTIADYLVKKYKFHKRPFAEPLKRGIMEFFGFSEEDVYGEKKLDENKFWKISPRRILQEMGTEIFRDRLGVFFPELRWVEDKFWVLNWYKWFKKNGHLYDGIVIPDLRFLNEIELIKKCNHGFIVRVTRKEANEDDSHQSETELDHYPSFDLVIENNGTFEELYRKIDAFMKKHVTIIKGD